MFFQRPNCDWLVVGLGNPGTKYENTRHNIGFRCADQLAQMLHTQINRSKWNALSAMATHGDKKILLLKPQTFMNLSGQAVRDVARFYRMAPERIVVIYDDIALPVGRLRVRADGSAGGHNGMKSIIAELGSQAFARVRIGVGAKPHPAYDLADWVLSAFTSAEEQTLEQTLNRAAEAVLTLIDDGYQAAASEFNGK